jgi:hypothetical protein
MLKSIIGVAKMATKIEQINNARKFVEELVRIIQEYTSGIKMSSEQMTGLAYLESEGLISTEDELDIRDTINDIQKDLKGMDDRLVQKMKELTSK